MSSDLSAADLGGVVPRHIAIIMDGNGRWARSRFMPRPFGHRAGMAAVRETVEGCIEAGVGILTIFAFSLENWSRPRDEIGALMTLLEEFIERELPDLKQNGVRVEVIGDINRLGERQLKAVETLVNETADGTRLALNICISYSGRAEIAHAARRLAERVAAGEIAAADIDEQTVADHLYTAGIPDPDLLIRTSGELRISNFLLWQLAYTEIYVTEVLWPDFDRKELLRAIKDYQRRERRFGKVTA